MNTFRDLLNTSQKVVFLTGAGVSTDSGIPDFKQSDDSWAYDRPRQEIISVPYFLNNPKNFWKVYREVFSEKLGDADPNANHKLIADLEKTHDVTVLTQNVEGLHQKAGSSKVFEIHGSNKYAHCLKNHVRVTMESVKDDEVPKCVECHKPLKPDVSLFMDGVSHMREAREHTITSDLFVVMGTSLRVGPVNELPYFANPNKTGHVVWLGNEEPPESHDFVFTEKWIGDFRDFTLDSDLVEIEDDDLSLEDLIRLSENS